MGTIAPAPGLRAGCGQAAVTSLLPGAPPPGVGAPRPPPAPRPPRLPRVDCSRHSSRGTHRPTPARPAPALPARHGRVPPPTSGLTSPQVAAAGSQWEAELRAGGGARLGLSLGQPRSREPGRRPAPRATPARRPLVAPQCLPCGLFSPIPGAGARRTGGFGKSVYGGREGKENCLLPKTTVRDSNMGLPNRPKRTFRASLTAQPRTPWAVSERVLCTR